MAKGWYGVAIYNTATARDDAANIINAWVQAHLGDVAEWTTPVAFRSTPLFSATGTQTHTELTGEDENGNPLALPGLSWAWSITDALEGDAVAAADAAVATARDYDSGLSPIP